MREILPGSHDGLSDAIVGAMPTRQQLEYAASLMDTLPAIADRLGITDEALFKLERTQESFPLPIAVWGRARVYWVEEVLEFHLHVGRIYGRGRTISERRASR
jgi:hypothetical protein